MSLLDHNPQEVAGLIYESAPELFELLWGRKAIPRLTTLVQHTHSHYSYRHVYVAEVNRQVVGIATMIGAADLTDEADYKTVLNRWEQLRIQLVQWLVLRHMLQQDYPAGTVYIANLAVDSAYRGRRIGTQLLQRCLTNAAATGATAAFISVDIDNPRAQKLYESLGFEVVSVKTMHLFTRIIGSRVLMRSL